MLMGFDWGIERSFIEKLSTRDLDCKQREKRCDEMKKNNIYIYIYIYTHMLDIYNSCVDEIELATRQFFKFKYFKNPYPLPIVKNLQVH
jgi:hypothetical protein